MGEYTILHQTNIIVHVCAGTIALLVGLIALATKKGKKRHRKSGRIFLWLLSIVILTGLLGVFVFKGNAFLIVITVLSGYNGYSGYRCLITKSNLPQWQDIVAVVVGIAAGSYFLYYFKTIGMMWAPVIIYASVGFLFFIISYDLLRYLIPRKKYKTLWLYEHIYKMIAAFTALLSAATGTVLPHYKPYSQFLPSLLGTSFAIFAIIYVYRKRASLRLKPS